MLRQNCRSPSEGPPPWAEDHSAGASEQVREPSSLACGLLLCLFLPFQVFLVASGLFVGAYRLSLAVAPGLFVMVHGLLLLQAVERAGSVVNGMKAWFPQGKWDLSSLTRDQTCILCIGRWILNHWTTRGVPSLCSQRPFAVVHPPKCFPTVVSSPLLPGTQGA